MRRFFGSARTSWQKPKARCPHQLRPANHERCKSRSQTVTYGTLESCPEDIRNCISELANRAIIEKEEPAYVARQIYFVVKEIGVRVKHAGRYIEQFSLTVLCIQARRQKVQFRILQGSVRVILNLPAEDILAAA